MKMGVSSVVVLSALCLSCMAVLVRGNGCRSAGINGEPLCCEGKDITCVTSGYRSRSPFYQPCYCDAACTYTGDCCGDYTQTCRAVDCEVEAWSYWSGCSVHCGIGISERRRDVVTKPKNAGRKCPPLRQVKACFSSFCDVSQKYGNSVALILPHHYGDRRGDPELNAAANFIYRDRMPFKSYCVFFKLKGVHKRCHAEPYRWTDSLRRSEVLCVECDRPAYGMEGRCHGEGVRKERTRFAAVDVRGCRGRWVQQSVQDDCTCNTGADYIFI